MDPFIGQIMLFAGTYAPQGWAICDGRLLPVQQYQALYSIIGTYYGGDGVNNFGLPDLRGRVPVGAGQGTGLSNYQLGSKNGYENVVLTSAQMPSHTHGANLQVAGHIMANNSSGEDDSPVGNSLAKAATDFYSTETPTVAMNSSSIAITGTVTVQASGNNSGHTNIQPCQAINYCIALEGIYPPRP